LTTHARGPFGRFWLGSVADKLMRTLPVPVLLVHPKDGAADLQEDRPLQHVLLPLDGSPLAEQMIQPAVALGSVSNADYALLRVVKAIMPSPYAVEGATMAAMAQSMLDRIQQTHDQLRAEAQAYLDGV